MYNNCNNDDIVPLAMRGVRAETKTGNMSTAPGRMYYTGYLPARIREAFGALGHRISQTIYSYVTPIAVLIDGTWIIPDVTYSTTTSTKHQTHLYQLGGEYIPWDCSAAELERVVNGYMRYRRGYNGKVGTWVPGPNWEPGC